MKEGGSRHSHDASKIDSGESSSVFLLADTIHPSSYRNGSQIEGKAMCRGEMSARRLRTYGRNAWGSISARGSSGYSVEGVRGYCCKHGKLS